MGTERIVVYTAMCGDIDPPRDDILCFTENDFDEFKDPRHNSRVFKLLPHLWLPGNTEWSIWVDGNIFLTVSPKELIKLTGKAQWAVFAHNFRHTLEEEAKECKRLNKADHTRIDAQLKDCGNPPSYMAPLAMCGIQIRKVTQEVEDYCNEWWAEYCRWRTRDQLSFPYIVGPFARYLPAASRSYESPYFRLVPHRRRQ